MSTVDIGTLAGNLTFEDKASFTMDAVLNKVIGLENKFDDLDGTVQKTATGFVIAEVAIKAFDFALGKAKEIIGDFTTEGAGIADVEDSFVRLTQRAGQTGEVLLGVLREGTHSTITDFELMKSVNDQLAAGVQLTDQQYRTLAEGGFALAQAKGIDVKAAFDTLNDAMLTGNTRAVRFLTGRIDMAAAEDEYAKKLNTTAERLSVTEKQEAGRAAILEAITASTGRLGEQTDGVDEIVAQLNTTWDNFYNNLIKTIASSPAVITMFGAIRDAVQDAFGDDGAELTDTFVDGVDRIADVVTSSIPVVVDWFGKARSVVVALYDGAVNAWEKFGPFIVSSFTTIKDWIVNVYDAVINSWNALPDWMKTVAERSALTAAGLYVLSAGGHEAAGMVSSLITNLTHMGETAVYTTEGFHILAGAVAQLGVWIKVLDFSSIADAGASFKLLGASIAGTIGPLGVAAIYAAALYAAYELGKWKPVSDFFFELGLELQGFTQAEQDAMMAAEASTQAHAAASKEAKTKTDITKTLNEITAQAAALTEEMNAKLQEQSGDLSEASEQTRAYKLAWEHLDALGVTWQETMTGINEGIRQQVVDYAALGASVEDLYTAFPKLTKAQAEAAVAGAAAAKEIRAINLETFEIISGAHGDNINDWIRGEEMKLEVTLESLRLQGKLTDEMLDAQMAKFNATVDAEIDKRREGDDQSQSFYEADVERAQAKLDLMMKDTTKYTDFAIREAERELAEKKRTLDHWESAATDANRDVTAVTQAETGRQVQAIDNVGAAWMRGVDAIIDNVEYVRTLSGELITLEEKAQRLSASVTSQLQPFTQNELQNIIDSTPSWERGPAGSDIAIWKRLADLEQREGTVKPTDNASFFALQAESLELARLRQWAQGKERPASLPSFREGGAGDFGSGTLAMLHGKEIITPLDKAMGGNITQIIYVNGTAEDVARKINKITMDGIKQTRQVRIS